MTLIVKCKAVYLCSWKLLTLSKLIKFFDLFRDAADATHDLDGKDMQGGRVRVELARDPRDRRGGGRGDRGGDRGGDRDGGRFGGRGGGGRDGRPRGNPPGPHTKYRLIIENMSSRTSWQVSHKVYIRNCWTEMLARSLGHIIILVHFRSKR
jgi:hypothetical protein